MSICEAYVARSVVTEGVHSAVGGASSAAGSGRGPPQTNVLLQGAFDPTWYLASAKIAYRMERFRQSIGRCYLEFCRCYFRACWVCLVFKGVFRACLNVSRPHALQKGACCKTLPGCSKSSGPKMYSLTTSAATPSTRVSTTVEFTHYST